MFKLRTISSQCMKRKRVFLVYFTRQGFHTDDRLQILQACESSARTLS